MSVFTQFVGNTPPFGQLVPLWDSRNNPTIDGVEYLKTGVLKAISGYSTLATNWPSYALNQISGSPYTAAAASGTSAHYLTDGTRYYAFATASGQVYYGTNVTSSWSSSVASSNSATDACRFGASATLISVNSNNNTQNQYIIGTTATAINTTNNMRCVASNTAGTLAVMATSNAAVAANIWTSTNGTAWTSRTPAGAGATGSDNLIYATWSPVGNTFIYVGSTGIVFTATDGFTLTSRGIPTGLTTSISASVVFPNKFCASSASSTLISVLDVGSIPYIIKTTNGTSYTAIPVTNTLFDGAPIGAPRLVYLNSAYYAIFAGGQQTVNPVAVLFKSTDEGVTWTKVPNIYTGYTIISGVTTFYTDYLSLMNGNIVAFIAGSGSAAAYYGVLSSYDTATHIGVPVATSQMAGISSIQTYNAPNYYIRIK